MRDTPLKNKGEGAGGGKESLATKDAGMTQGKETGKGRGESYRKSLRPYHIVEKMVAR